jgi:hypothetical protein
LDLLLDAIVLATMPLWGPSSNGTWASVTIHGDTGCWYDDRGYSGRSGADDLADELSEYNPADGNKRWKQGCRVQVVALGPNNRYAVIYDDGGWRVRGPDKLLHKMNQIDCSQVKQISFGPSDAWAIVMNDGWCHASCRHYPEGPLDAINENQYNIKYVAFTAETGQWIVGIVGIGFEWRGMSKEMVEFMEEVAVGGGVVRLVNLGRKKSYWIVETTDFGHSRWNFTSEGNFHTAAKGARLRVFH